ncbi:MAG: hypothetical protein ACI4L8_09295 [Candidatus Fimadaptatus sp.]
METQFDAELIHSRRAFIAALPDGGCAHTARRSAARFAAELVHSYNATHAALPDCGCAHTAR